MPCFSHPLLYLLLFLPSLPFFSSFWRASSRFTTKLFYFYRKPFWAKLPALCALVLPFRRASSRFTTKLFCLYRKPFLAKLPALCALVLPFWRASFCLTPTRLYRLEHEICIFFFLNIKTAYKWFETIQYIF